MGENSPEKIEDFSDLEWITLRKNVNEPFNDETTAAKFVRKFKENPFVPIGAVATTCCIGLGIWNFRTGRSATQQFYMRARVFAQGFTVAAFLVGLSITAVRGEP